MNAHPMKARPLNDLERDGMAAERRWIDDLLAGFGSDVRLTGSTDDIPTLHTLLDRGPFTDDATGELELLGGAFGDVLANQVGLCWVVYEDEMGADFALQLGARDFFVFPRDMLVKRIEAGEPASKIDLRVMLDEVARAAHAHVREA